MLEITIAGGQQLWDEAKQEFLYPDEVTLQLEHSLVSLSKWEQIWEKPFLGDEPKTNAQTIDYIRHMTLNKDVDPLTYDRLTNEHLQKISDYINAKMTATWFTDPPGPKAPPKKTIITNELIYYWMVALQIPLDFENRHLNHLFTLIRVCNEKNAPAKKGPRMGKRDLAAQRRALNEQRQQQFNTTG